MPNLCYHPPDSPQPLPGAKTARAALARVERFLQAMAIDATPTLLTLDVHDAQSEALARATRRLPGAAEPDHAAAYAASGQQPPPWAQRATALLGPGERFLAGSGATGDLWVTRWQTWPERPGFAADFSSMFALADARGEEPDIARCWDDRDDVKRHEPALALTARWNVRWRDPASGAALPTLWDADNTLWLFIAKKPLFSLDVAFPFDDVDAGFAAFVFALEQSLGATLKDARIRVRHGDPARHVWGFWPATFDRSRWRA